MVNQTNKQTFDFPLVGEVCNLAGVECPINSKVYHSSSVGGGECHKAFIPGEAFIGFIPLILILSKSRLFTILNQES